MTFLRKFLEITLYENIAVYQERVRWGLQVMRANTKEDKGLGGDS